MKKFAHSLSAIAVTATLSVFLFSACTDDSSDNNPSTPPLTVSSSSETPMDALSSGISSQESSQATGLTESSSATIIPAESIVIDNEGFADIQFVFQSIQPNEKAIFIVRHGEREPYVTKESPLTEEGVEQSISVGQKIASNEELFYIFTDFVRTETTCRNVALGRGQATFPYDTSNVFTSESYIKDEDILAVYNTADGNSTRSAISKWSYDDMYTDAFYDLKETCEKIIADLSANPKARITFICSHDEFLVPMVAYLTDKKTDLRVHENRNWLNYLAGVAIITNDEGVRRAYAIKGLESGLY